MYSASDAVKTATIAEHDASAKPRRRPIRFINIAAGMVVSAVAKTIIDNGTVAHAGLLDKDVPINPPRVTKTIEPVAEIN